MSIDFPFHVGNKGAIAIAEADKHMRDGIEQVLFTNPGERVNLPEFGCGIRRFIFAGNSDVLAATMQFTVMQSLERWMGNVIKVDQVNVKNIEETLYIEIIFTKKETRERMRTGFSEKI